MKKNMCISLIAKIVAIITGLIVQHQILIAYGSTYNGLTSSIGQVMSYLTLLEAGLGAASCQAFYKPLSIKDWGEISGIFTATRKAYNRVAFLFGGLLIAVSLLLPLAVSGEIDYFTAGVLTLITGGSSVLSYLVGGKYGTLLSADNKMYIQNLLNIGATVLSCIFRVIALSMGHNIIIVQLINLATVGLNNLGRVIYVRIRYSQIDFKAKLNMEAIGKRWNVFVHQIAGLVVNHTDIMILTVFSSLKLVSVYSVYNMVFGQMSTMITSVFSGAPQATFGRLYYRDKEEFSKFFRIYENLFSILLFILMTISLIMILPFVSVYTKGVEDIKYVDPYLPVLFSLILLMNQIRTPALITINVSGSFKETQSGAIIEALINIGVSLFLFFATPLGLYGLLIGTVCSYIYRTTDVIWFIYKNVLKEKCTGFIKIVLINAAISCVMYILLCKLFPIYTDNFYEWVLYASIVSFVTCLSFIVINYLFNREIMNETIKYVKRSLKRVA